MWPFGTRGSIQGRSEDEGNDGLLVNPDGESHEQIAREQSTTMKQEHADESNSFFEQASLRGTIINIINAVIGGGILALPFAVRMGGLVGGTVSIILAALLAERTAYFVLYVADRTRSRIYAQVGDALLGTWGGRMVDYSILFQNWGLTTSYVTLMGDILPPVFQTMFPKAPAIVHDRTLILIIISAVCFFPLSALPNLDALRFTSAMALLCIGIFLVTMVVVACLAPSDPTYRPKSFSDPINLGPESMVGFLISFPIMASAYVAHNNILLLFTELRRRSSTERESRWTTKIEKMMFCVRVALGFCCTTYVIQSVAGYLLFRKTTFSDVFKNFTDKRYPWIIWIKVAYALVILLSFPVIAFALRKSVHSVAFGLRASVTTYHRIGEAFVIVLVAGTIGILVPNVSILFGFTGAITAVNIMYVFPSTFFLLLWWRAKIGYYDNRKEELQDAEDLVQASPRSSTIPLGAPGVVIPGAGSDITTSQVITAALAIVVGILVCITGTIANVITVVNPNAAN